MNLIIASPVSLSLRSKDTIDGRCSSNDRTPDTHFVASERRFGLKNSGAVVDVVVEEFDVL